MRWKKLVPVVFVAGFEDRFGFFPGETDLMGFCCALTVPVAPTSGPIDPSRPGRFSDEFGGESQINMGPPTGLCIPPQVFIDMSRSSLCNSRCTFRNNCSLVHGHIQYHGSYWGY